MSREFKSSLTAFPSNWGAWQLAATWGSPCNATMACGLPPGFSNFPKLMHSEQPNQEARKIAKEDPPIPKAKTIGLVVSDNFLGSLQKLNLVF